MEQSKQPIDIVAVIAEDIIEYVVSQLRPMELHGFFKDSEGNSQIHLKTCYIGSVGVLKNRAGKHYLQMFINDNLANESYLKSAEYYKEVDANNKENDNRIKQEVAKVFTTNLLILCRDYDINPITIIDSNFDKTVNHVVKINLDHITQYI